MPSRSRKDADQQGVIIVGHTRYKAALKLGLDTVPVHVATVSQAPCRRRSCTGF
jgi:ParB-like chromosome segregation protein Spo0J